MLATNEEIKTSIKALIFIKAAIGIKILKGTL
jgi:hypothetical protein